MKDDSMLALGGVWRRWRSPHGKMMDTFAIITTEPNELVVEKTDHDRMPLIVKRSDWHRWIEPSDQERPPIDLVRPFDSDKMKAWRADTRTNSVKNNDATLGDPAKEENDEQLGMFDE